jgi:hypothetical protein
MKELNELKVIDEEFTINDLTKKNSNSSLNQIDEFLFDIKNIPVYIIFFKKFFLKSFS